MAGQTERKYTVRQGDTWQSIAARELGNGTLSTELAGWNGASDVGAPAEGSEIRILGAGGDPSGQTDTSTPPSEDTPQERVSGERTGDRAERDPRDTMADADRRELEELRRERTARGGAPGPGPGH